MSTVVVMLLARPVLAIAKRASLGERAPAAPRLASDAAVRPRPDAYACRRLRLLVVDDRALVGEQIARMLPTHDVTRVTSAEAAVAALRRPGAAPLDAILYSLGMPRLSGFAFANLLSTQQPALRPRLVFLVDQAPSSALLHNIERTGTRWITKPLHYAPLVSAVDLAAGTQHATTAIAKAPLAPPALASAA